MTNSNITVLKFGGSVLRSEADLPRAVHDVYRYWRQGQKVVAVVSAFKGTTESLLDRSRAFGEDPQPEALAALLSTGEAASAAWLTLALKRSGIPATLLTLEQAGILTSGDTLDAEPVGANAARLREELEGSVVVVAGYAGLNRNGCLTLLGRGGTDLTALFLANELNARCVLLKDVEGLYRKAPTDGLCGQELFTRANYRTLERHGGKLVQAKAIRYAEERGQTFEIGAIGQEPRTIVWGGNDEVERTPAKDQKRLRVAILGCGTVGAGVYELLKALPDLFEIVGVANLDPDKALTRGVEARHLEPDVLRLIERDCDIVIELVGGIEPARSYVEHALKAGRHVVSANKALIAEAGIELQELAAREGVQLRFSAAVGGALPALEAVALAQASDEPIAISGIINGTCNFICSQFEKGSNLDDAVNLAQELGYAEADPTLDIDGTDAAQKLVLLMRQAFNVDIPVSDVARHGVEDISASQILSARNAGRTFRLVAECRKDGGKVVAQVRPVELPLSHPFVRTTGADNCLLIETASGRNLMLRGRGAGRYPTSEAVVADLFDLKLGSLPACRLAKEAAL
jgi:homoserine dehydrogenase